MAEEEEENKKDEWTFWEIFLGILFVVLVLASVGLIFKWLFDRNKRKRRRSIYKTSKKKNTTFARNDVDDAVTTTIHDYSDKSQIPERTYRIVLFWGRLVVVIGLCLANWLFYDSIKNESVGFDWNKQLNFNEAILLGYSLVGFIFYGSVNKLTDRFKRIIISGLLWIKKKMDQLKAKRQKK